MASTSVTTLIGLQMSHQTELEVLYRTVKEQENHTFTLAIVEMYLERLKEICGGVRRTHEEILMLSVDMADPYVAEGVFPRIQGVEYQASALIHSNKAELETEASTRTASSAGNVEAGERPSGTAKLPRVPLPTFSGRVEEWESFRDLFTTLVHDSPELSDSTKLQYLKGCLKGPAAELIKNVATTNANYHSAWLGLRQRFYHPRLIVNNHLRALTEIPSMRRESALGMRALADESQRIIRALENMQMPVKHWDVWAANCNSRERCSRCQGAHHTLLHGSIAHRSNASGPSAGNGSGETNKADDQPSADFRVHTASIATGRHSVLLATAQLTVVGPHGRSTRARALLDQGSEVSFVSETIANLLGLQRRRVDVSLTGVGACPAGKAKSATRLVMRSLRDPGFQFETNALILSRMSSQLPNRQIREVNSDWLAGLALADVHFTVPDSVDIILGADVYGRLLRSGVRNFPDTCLVAQDTALGWIISGPVSLEGPRRAVPRGHIAIQTSHCKTDGGLDDALRRFWELEELPCIQKRVEA
ncbi:hypothetical protein M0802_014976 [Mischocyttarus mexicanus]|nr:hypothetical protein M0802_014976 [Mischocyttarus mexicanus]